MENVNYGFSMNYNDIIGTYVAFTTDNKEDLISHSGAAIIDAISSKIQDRIFFDNDTEVTEESLDLFEKVDEFLDTAFDNRPLNIALLLWAVGNGYAEVSFTEIL